MKTVEIEIKNVYGIKKVYPVCETGKLFAKIAGTITLSPAVLSCVKSLGYELQVKQQIIDLKVFNGKSWVQL